MKRFFVYLTIALMILQVGICSVYAESNNFTQMYIYDYWTNSMTLANQDFENQWLKDLNAFATCILGQIDCAPFALMAGQSDNMRQSIGQAMADKIDAGELTREDYGQVYFYQGEPYFWNGAGGYYFKLPKQYESEIGPITGKSPEQIRQSIENGLQRGYVPGSWTEDTIECFIRDTTGDDVFEHLWETFQYCRDNNVTTYNNGKYVHDPVWTENKFHAYLSSRSIWQYYPGTGTSFQNHPWRLTKRTTYTNSKKTYYSYDLYYFVQSYTGSDTQYTGQRGFVRQASGRGYPADGSGGWAGTVIANRYLPVGSVVGAPSFIPYGNMGKKPTKWPNLKAYSHSQLPNGIIVKVSDLDGVVEQASDLANDAVDADPDVYDSGDTTEDGMPIVPDDTPWPDPIPEYTTPEHNDGPIDPDPEPIIPSTIPLPTISNNGLPPITLEPLDLPDLENLFPFCIPFDIYHGLQAVALVQGEPVWRIPIHIVIQDYTVVDDEIVIDLMQWNLTTIWSVIRGVILLAFIILLAIFTIRIVN